jgi:hypothetical protein
MTYPRKLLGEVPRTPVMRTSQNSVPANFGETPFYEVRCIAGRGVEAPVLRLLELGVRPSEPPDAPEDQRPRRSEAD